MSPRILTTSSGTNQAAFAPLDWALFLAVALIWGSSFLLMDIGLGALEPGLITWMRVSLGAAVLAMFPRARKPVDAEDRPRLVVLSFLWVAVPFTLFPIAQQWVNSAVAGMLNGAMPVFAVAFGSIMLRSLPRGSQLTGLFLGFAGVVIMGLGSGGSGATRTLGVGLILGATACYGLAVNISIPLTQRHGSLAVMARILVLAAVWTAPLGVWGLFGSRFAWGPVLAVSAAGAIGTGVAFVIMGTLVGRVGSARGSFTIYLIPVVALVLGRWLRSDTVAPVALVGAALVIAGALLASRREMVRSAGDEIGSPDHTGSSLR
jgi:drug/metabolite transporter (DMT)-like permease